MCEAEAYLADLLASGAKECQFFGQCEHTEFEIWITWPRAGFVGEPVRIWHYSLNDYLYNDEVYSPASEQGLDQMLKRTFARSLMTRSARFDQTSAMLEAQRRTDDEEGKVVKAAADDLNEKLLDEQRKRRLEFDKATLSLQQIEDVNKKVSLAESNLVSKLAEHPDRFRAAFKGTVLAKAFDGGLPILGDIRIQYLEDFLTDPREPRLNQLADEMFEPAGIPADGVRIRWDRTLPGSWPAYKTIDECQGSH
jgi:hypothetical protein